MAILVDQPLWTFRGEKWSHLVSDTSYDELHLVANQIGIRRIGFQGDHYDLPSRLLPAAISAGATQVDSRVLVRRLREAKLRKPRSYQGWSPLLRRTGIDPDLIDITQVASLVAGALPEGPAAGTLLETCEALWRACGDVDAPLHQLFVLRSPTQLAVAFDTDVAARDRIAFEAGQATGSTAEVWLTGMNPQLPVDVLINIVERPAG